jgi:hypothetical protein
MRVNSYSASLWCVSLPSKAASLISWRKETGEGGAGFECRENE